MYSHCGEMIGTREFRIVNLMTCKSVNSWRFTLIVQTLFLFVRGQQGKNLLFHQILRAF